MFRHPIEEAVYARTMTIEGEEFAESTLGAGAVVVAEGHVLLVRLNYGRAKGAWILPGGLVNEGESFHEAMQREVLEETGVRVTTGPLIATRHRRREDGGLGGGANVYCVFLVHLAEKLTLAKCTSTLRWPTEELQDVRFWLWEEALQSPDVRPMTKVFLDLAREKLKQPQNPMCADVPSDFADNDTIYRF